MLKEALKLLMHWTVDLIFHQVKFEIRYVIDHLDLDVDHDKGLVCYNFSSTSLSELSMKS